MALTVPAVLETLLAKPVAVFGAGVSGEGVCALLAAVGARGLVYDAKGREFTAVAARGHAAVVYSPGFVPDHPWLKIAADAGLITFGELDFASWFWRGEVIAVTGTNGKTTTTEFLTHALRSVRRDAHATGNIGHPFSRLAAELAGGALSIAVCEVSSFQAETMQNFRANATLWTNFAEDHLERHPSMKRYFAAKWNLVARTLPAGAVFLGSSVRRHADSFGQPLSGVELVDTEGIAPDARLRGTVFAEYPQRENFLLVQAWWRRSGFSDAALYAAAATFGLGPHRLARVGESAGVTYWNDSKATNFHAVEAALTRFNSPVLLIAGGKPKGGDLEGFIRRLAGRVHHLLLIGATSDTLAAHAAAHGIPHTCCGTLETAVRLAREIAPSGSHVLLSPGFASFDQFRNYEDRGQQFEKLVREVMLTGVAVAPHDPANLG